MTCKHCNATIAPGTYIWVGVNTDISNTYACPAGKFHEPQGLEYVQLTPEQREDYASSMGFSVVGGD